MSFADAYLLKAGLRKALIIPEPNPGLKIIVTIPVLDESRLDRCLDSLYHCCCGIPESNGSCTSNELVPGFHTEVLILINAATDAPSEILEQNRATLEATRSWIKQHPHPSIDFHVWLDHSFGKKEAGVGTARKILMDEAARRFSILDRPEGIIASMDADALVQPNYLETLTTHFHGDQVQGGITEGGIAETDPHVRSEPDGCSIRFEHPLADHEFRDQESFSPEVYGAITQYELHLRYYLQAVYSTGYPYAYHTVGSAFAVRADIYCKEGGMNRRQGGEDFYFIQKVAQRGNFSQCTNTCVYPSPRPSHRVPFGTGPVVRRLSQGDESLMTYDPRPFGMLKAFFQEIGPSAGPDGVARENLHLPEPLHGFLMEQQFGSALKEIRKNSASPAAFLKRFWRWFNMFRIMKFMHYARQRGYPDIPVEEAASKLLGIIDPEHIGIPSIGSNGKKLLLIYRMLELR